MIRTPFEVLAEIEATKVALFAIDDVTASRAYYLRAQLATLRAEYGRALNHYCGGRVAINVALI